MPNDIINPEVLLQEQLAAINVRARSGQGWQRIADLGCLQAMESVPLAQLSQEAKQSQLSGRFQLARNALDSCPLETKATLVS